MQGVEEQRRNTTGIRKWRWWNSVGRLKESKEDISGGESSTSRQALDSLLHPEAARLDTAGRQCT